ncbi:3-isopropylmalate dehydrogenase [Priestia taiwanensis]|uniref:3-isopropylmalate dehydrogenase n=1 Tax=Priestia taiwanensis TaxID=1347902 RepID=A0A917AVP3_9BACI|nr:3-isopropylmalate dehydrogenase [Priestia taiwanensis]MBM7364719.1 3-isopropylmalate dehydrogenase [Priestia taiwanensis]GGE79096.1 3-isopropylmalate dehydrogenase [Priestia taiwanensis]
MEGKITCLQGDGIGPEVMASAKQVLCVIGEKYGHTFHLHDADFGGIAIDTHGEPLPEATLQACLSSDAILLGAVGGPKWDTLAVRPEAGLLGLRKALGLFANIRPVYVHPAVAHLSPLKEEIVQDVDFVVVRELTGGIYFSEPKERTSEHATDTLTYTREEITRIVQHAFELARTRRKKVTSIDKANVMESSKLWREVANEVGANYPDIVLEHLLVDAAAMELIRRPSRFDVVVTENLFGDILSDEASMIAGSLGLLPSASHSLEGPSLYEPIHGSAPDIAGENKANPLAMLYSVSMMLRHSFLLEEEANDVERAISAVLAAGYRTGDLRGEATTTLFTEKVVQELAGVKEGV